MSDSPPLKCKKCGKPIGYINISAKNFFAVKPQLDNIQLIGTCMDCSKKKGLYHRNF